MRKMMLRCLSIAVIGFACGCSDGDSNGSEGSNGGGDVAPVSGTVTLPSDASGSCAMVALDTDTTGANASARRGDGSYLLTYQLVSGTTVEFTLDDAPVGTYYLWAFVDVDQSDSDPAGSCEIMGGPGSGDFLGYYDTGLVPPNAANVTVSDEGDTTRDFEIGVFP